MTPSSLHFEAKRCLLSRDPDEKVALSHATAAAWRQGQLGRQAETVHAVAEPGRPQKPQLVAPRELNRRKVSSKIGHAALIHSICHIEFNAINLAWDAVYRFQDMPEQFYDDWVRVADEEASHYALLSEHLESLGYAYGDFPAHNGLWESAMRTAHDPMVRMALVPRVLEARGLDVTPGIVKKLQGINDERAVEILAIIHRDEIGHVEAGSRWFRYLCEQRGLDSQQVFQSLIEQYMKGVLRGPYDHDVRKQAGFTEEELLYLESAI